MHHIFLHRLALVSSKSDRKIANVESKKAKRTYLDEKNAIPFFYDYAKKNKENKVRIITKYGNIDVLSHRISNVRTWSYVANKRNWVENSDYWVQLTQGIEDKLSDKLHDELTKSFID